MEQKLMRERENKCIQEQPPGCTTQCPLHVDARGIANAVQKQDFAAGFALYQRMVPFPSIVSCICEQPCQIGCKRKEIDEAIAIRQLEKLCTVNNTTAPPIFLPPPKKQKVAIVGAGLSGLTTAVELARKGYQVTVFEATDKLGGRLREQAEDILPRHLLDKDFVLLTKLSIVIRYQCPIDTLAGLCANFDAVYLACGCRSAASNTWDLATDSDGIIMVDPISLVTSQPKVFAGGSLRRPLYKLSFIYSLADGKIAAISIDRLFQNASLTANREKEGVYETSLYANISGVEPLPRIRAADHAGCYTTPEAIEEASRCLLCECLECVKACEYLAHYRGYPKRYVREIYNNLSIVMGIHHANKMINSCSLCGLCAEVCPQKLDMGEICLEARQSMVEKNKMPPSAHDFALRDMLFSNSELCVLARHQPGYAASEWVFYPGCQLAASSPHYVEQLYGYLREKLTGGVGLMLGCCGAPATWAGQISLFQENLQNLEASWRKLGSPKMITACPTCYRLFKESLPNMAIESIWTLLERIGLPPECVQAAPGRKLAIHDSCTTRHEVQLQSSVRALVSTLGYQIEELPFSREHTNCCGYGGLMLYVNKELVHKVIERRITESQSDYLTYCSMCRDNFANQGKRTYHLLDLMFGKEQAAKQAGPGFSQRQENRVRLKQALLSEVWGEQATVRQPKNKLIITPEVLKIMEDRQILVSDVRQVIDYAEGSGNKLKDNVTGRYLAYFQPASVTYWVEYEPQVDGFLVCNAYSHRLVIG